MKWIVLSTLALSTLLNAQTDSAVTHRLITSAVRDSDRVKLHGSVHPLARAEFDKGAAPADLEMDRIQIVLKRSSNQEADLEALLKDQQSPESSHYHQWLTPDEFGQKFGASDADVSTITQWLASYGFRVNATSRGRTTIEFSGTAGLVSAAFRTQIHRYVVKGEEHWANASEPEIPAALAPAVASIASLHNFQSHPQLKVLGQMGKSNPLTTFSGGTHGISPGDFATIYNAKALYASGINGAGRTIAVLARSNINVQDVADFRKAFGLATFPVNVIVNGRDPGDLGSDEEAEAVLDATWSGAVAPNVTVDFILSASTNSSDGVFLSEQYAVDNNIGDVISSSFGSCESDSDQAGATAISQLAQQAAAQGQTFVVASGDSGSAGCDSPSSSSASHPASVNMLASTPYTIAVGGTQFNENGSSAYWSSSNDYSLSSAISYIPENVWNESGSGDLYASGGGPSIYFAKPWWQVHVTGIPLDAARDVPDVSLNASASHDGYLLCLRRSCASGGGGYYVVGGTSVSAPAFASIMALVNQQTGSRQGQAAPTLYQLAAQQSPASCNASGTLASNCIFNDVTVGTNAVPGEGGYAATAGYDMATGLGSVNIANLVNGWQNAGSFVTPLYALINNNSGLALDVFGQSTSYGGSVGQWGYLGGANQKWQLLPVQPGYYELQNSNSGLLLEVRGQLTNQGAQVWQWGSWGGANQQWQLIPLGNNYYVLQNRNSGLVLDVSGASTSYGAGVVQWPSSGAADQQWLFTKVQ